MYRIKLLSSTSKSDAPGATATSTDKYVDEGDVYSLRPPPGHFLVALKVKERVLMVRFPGRRTKWRVHEYADGGGWVVDVRRVGGRFFGVTSDESVVEITGLAGLSGAARTWEVCSGTYEADGGLGSSARCHVFDVEAEDRVHVAKMAVSGMDIVEVVYWV